MKAEALSTCCLGPPSCLGPIRVWSPRSQGSYRSAQCARRQYRGSEKIAATRHPASEAAALQSYSILTKPLNLAKIPHRTHTRTTTMQRRTLGPVSSSTLNARSSMGRSSMGPPSKGPQRMSMAAGPRQSMGRSQGRQQSLGKKSMGAGRMSTMGGGGGSRQDPVSFNSPPEQRPQGVGLGGGACGRGGEP